MRILRMNYEYYPNDTNNYSTKLQIYQKKAF